jgi:hypothetical protein
VQFDNAPPSGFQEISTRSTNGDAMHGLTRPSGFQEIPRSTKGGATHEPASRWEVVFKIAWEPILSARSWLAPPGLEVRGQLGRSCLGASLAFAIPQARAAWPGVPGSARSAQVLPCVDRGHG